MKIKLSKNKKIILLISGLGILTTSIVTPIAVIDNKNDNQEKENKNDIEKVIKMFEEKLDQQRIIILPSDSSGNIIANNKNEIVTKLEELIGNSNLKNVFIEVSMNQDQEISTSKQEIIVKVSKGKHSKIVSSSKAYFVKRSRTAQEIILEINDKDILIPANVSTQNQSEIQNAIKNQLKKENQTLSEDDLLKIAINNIESLTLDKKVEINLIIRVKNTNKEFKINVEKINLLKNSNIDDGENGMIFQDSFKNLWAMGKGTKLQVIEVNSDGEGYENEWVNNNDKTTGHELLKNSNIIHGYHGKIFQDSFKNLWAMGSGTKLQVLKVNSNGDGYTSEGWSDNNNRGLLNGSNIDDGNGGTIFQDSFGNLWTMGSGRKLQVLKANSNGDGYVTTSWSDDNTQGLLNGSNITYDYGGKIFQDSFKNLWAMGSGQTLQVLKANNSKDGYVENWTNDTAQRLLNGSNIINGLAGTIFQDKFKNLWTMGKGTPLQVLKVNSDGSGYAHEGWTNDNTQILLNGSKINNGENGTIFQDSFGNLWIMGKGTPLQVLKVNNSKDGYVESWTDNNFQGLLKGSNIINEQFGTIFQDKFKNLWTMGKGTPLQVLKVNSDGIGYVSEGWTNNNIEGLLNGSKIINGLGGTIFQDFFGNLWAMAQGKKLQVLIADLDNTDFINSWLYEENKK